jgi:hypothetical protein
MKKATSRILLILFIFLSAWLDAKVTISKIEYFPARIC